MTETTDLLVIGAGPAGLTTAIEARLAGIDAIVVDPRTPPIDVACGEGLMPAGVERLYRLGIDLRDWDGADIRGIRYLDSGTASEARFKSGSGRGVRRTTLHQALHRRAEELGVGIRWNVAARKLTAHGVETDAGEIRARWLAAADGRRSRIRTLAGLDGRDRRRCRYGVRRHYSVVPWSEFVEVYWADGSEAYVTPVGHNLVGVAILTDRTPVNFERMLACFPLLEERLEGQIIESRDRGAGPFGHRPRTVVRNNLALVGDASGSLDPITGEGLSIAFAQARALIQSIRRGHLEDYVRNHRRIMRTPRLLTGLLLIAERHPRLRRRMLQIFASNPRCFEALVDLAASERLKSAPTARRSPTMIPRI